MEFSQELKQILQPGQAVRVFYRKGNPNNKICYIRAIVDGNYIVYRSWSKYKNRWRYFIEAYFLFQYLYDDGHLTPIKTRWKLKSTENKCIITKNTPKK